MADDSTRREGPVIGEGYVIPITGLLALIFALMAGGTAYPAIQSGSLAVASLPVIFGTASLVFIRLRKRYLEAKAE